jgi:hypothetical protein
MTPLNTILNILLQLIGLGAAFCIAYYFFREQQKTDFDKILDDLRGFGARYDIGEVKHHGRFNAMDTQLSQIIAQLDNFTRDLNSIKTATDTESILKEVQSIENLRKSYDSLHLSINDLPNRMIEGFRALQERFEKRIQSKIARQMGEITASIQAQLVKEVGDTVPSSTDKRILVGRLETLIESIIASLSKFQNELVRLEVAKASEEVVDQVRTETTKVLEDAKEVGNTLNALPRLGSPNVQ